MMEDMTLEKRILSTNDWGLVALLHEGLIDRFKASTNAIENKDYEELNLVINRSRDILTELIVIFNENDDLSTNLRELYSFTNKLITNGEIKKDASFFQEATDVINPICEGFKELEKEETGNIVTGLTYGKANLGEHSRKSNKTFQG